MRRPPPIPRSSALHQMLEKSGELDRILDGRGLDFSGNGPNPPATPPPVFDIPAADWAAEEQERQARERQARERELDAALAARLESEPDHERGLDEAQLEEEPAGHPPPRRRPWPRSSP